jgi:hypothetical protein
MAGDDDAESRGFGLEIEAREIVQNVDSDARDFDDFGFGQLACPCGFVDVAANRRDLRDSGKLIENFWRTHVAGVNDVLRAAQGFERFRAKQAVRIGDDTDEDCSSRFSVLSSQLLAISCQPLGCQLSNMSEQDNEPIILSNHWLAVSFCIFSVQMM